MPQRSGKVYEPVIGWLQAHFGKHFSRFAGVAVLSLAVTQIVLAIAYQVVGTGGTATALGWLAGFIVSYLLSRRAWDRRGRPQLLKETLPFGVIAVGTLVVLTTAGHFASVYAKSHALPWLEAAIVVNGCVLLANVVTFVIRFLLLHFVLFANRPAGGHADSAEPVTAETIPAPVPVAVPAVGSVPVGGADQEKVSS